MGGIALEMKSNNLMIISNGGNVMFVDELISLLSRFPSDYIVMVDTGDEEDSSITDVLVGTGVLRGFVFIKVESESDDELGGEI